MTIYDDDQDGDRRAMEQFESRRRFERKPKSSAELLSKLISRRGFTQELFQDELQAAWQKVTGARYAGKTQATLIRRGILEIIVDSSPALQQLGFEKAQLLQQIREALPNAGIRALRFRVGTIRT